jgi:discs large protein 5
LQRNQVYPIVLLIKFKSAKQIKEIKDPRYSTDKISAKAAKEMFEHALKLESDYRQYISGKLVENFMVFTQRFSKNSM